MAGVNYPCRYVYRRHALSSRFDSKPRVHPVAARECTAAVSVFQLRVFEQP
jgi:hypothetical protein